MPQYIHNSACVITVEGVLQKITTSAYIPLGLQLYHGLAETFNLLLVSDSSKEELDYWLRLENLNKHGAVVYNDEFLQKFSVEERRQKQVVSLRNRGYNIDLVVEPDPAIASRLLFSGFSVLNFLHSAYAIPEWRPDYEEKVVPWNELEERVRQDAILKQKDERLKQDK